MNRMDRLRYDAHRVSGSISIAIHAIAPGRGWGMHTHADFAEVFWIVSGQAEHLWMGRRMRLGPGHIQFITRDDQHALASAAGPFRMVNLAIRHSQLERWRRQGVFGTAWPWAWHGPVRLEARQLARLEQLLASMSPVPDTTDCLWLLAGVIREVRDAQNHHASPGHGQAPPWLDAAIARWRAGDPADGVPRLAQLAGCSREHLARTVRRHFAVSASGLLNRLRSDRAAEALRSTENGILAIALDAGFSGLGQFYRCFRQSYRTTPLAYRRGFRGIVGHPGWSDRDGGA